MEGYQEPLHKSPLLKMQGDLQRIIQNRSVIQVQYVKGDGNTVNRTLLPCLLRYDLGYLYLVAYHQDSEAPYAAYFRVDRIYSFSVVRRQTGDETRRVERYLQTCAPGIVQMYGGDFCSITLRCRKSYYPYLHDRFRGLRVVREDEDAVTVELGAFAEGFARWVVSQPPDCVQVLEPPELLRKGRFDEIFYVGLPNGKEREKIFEIHIQKRRPQDLKQIRLSELVGKTEGYSGADIEGVVRDAVEAAFADDKAHVQTSDILWAINNTHSLSEIMKDDLDRMAKEYKTRKFKNASK